MYQKLFFSSCLALFSSFAFAQSEVSKNQAVERIDIQQYAGKWYEIAHFPMFFQRNCMGDTTAEYKLNPDNTVNVVNRCRNKQNQIDQAEGVAYAQNEGKSKLKVSFLPKGLRWVPFTKGDYWVLRVDPNYQVALVGGPSQKYLWILSRTPTLDEQIYNDYVQTARQYGYDVSQLVKTSHKSP
ncbi:lipocalin family protein [Acinetobacter haemolyticus]|uniref:lipocalin family protein n=1 Tax=Acinetobacter haemolyticus TaxID=29430 RepID=UPI000D6982C8|nr:lipocalin family protein [Acinetobacter haemolyticus]